VKEEAKTPEKDEKDIDLEDEEDFETIQSLKKTKPLGSPSRAPYGKELAKRNQHQRCTRVTSWLIHT
jgi:hypothetical protein